MTKAAFFQWCNQHDPKYGLSVLVMGSDPVAYVCLEQAIYLSGAWHNGTVTRIHLYQPFPGRQFEHRTQVPAMFDKATAKFQRWLEEWRSRK